jgi:hypothetical protein
MAMVRGVMGWGFLSPSAHLQQLPKRLRVGQAVVVADFEQRRGWQDAVPDQCLASANGTPPSPPNSRQQRPLAWTA